MKIIILGAGRVGQSVADSLVSERNDITVIDTDAILTRDHMHAQRFLREVDSASVKENASTRFDDGF